MTTLAEKHTRFAVGAATGVTFGAGTAAAVSAVVGRVLVVASQTSAARLVGAGALRVAPAAIVASAPAVATGLAVGLTLYSAYRALAPVAAQAQEARRRRDADADVEKNLGTANRSLARADAALSRVANGEIESRLQQMERDGSLADYQRRIGATPDGVLGTKATSETRRLAREYESRRAPAENTAPANKPSLPVPAPSSLWDDVKSIFKEDPNSPYAQRRRQMSEELESVRKQVNNEISGKNASGVAGAGKNYDKLVERQKDLETKVKDLDKEERENNPFRQGFNLFAPVGAAVGGYMVGGSLGHAAIDAAKKTGHQVAVQVGKLGKTAAELTRAAPSSVIAGTVKGDRAKALVNEAYARGGAQQAFASPGYPSPPKAETLFANTGKPTTGHYILPGLNVALGGAEVAASFKVDDPNARAILRNGGSFEMAMGLGTWKALAGAPGVRPAAMAISAIEGLRQRIVRETATRAPAGVAIAKGAGNLAMARGEAAVAGNVAVGKVAASELRAKVPAIQAGASVGVAKARGAAAVEIAEVKGKQAAVRQVKRAQVNGYKDTWQDTRGRVYHRKDTSVRKPNERSKRVAANDNREAARRVAR